MRPLDDAFASTSFLDLLACGLSAVVIISVASGGESTPNQNPSAVVSVYQTASDSVNHLVAVRVGEIVWYSSNWSLGDSAELHAYSKLDSARGQDVCDTNTALGRSVSMPQQDGVTAFAKTQGREFASAVLTRYGIRAVVTDASANFPARVELSTRESELLRLPAIDVFYNLCGFDPPHAINVYLRSSVDSNAGDETKEIFATSNVPRNRAQAEGQFYCSQTALKDPLLAVHVTLDPLTGASTRVTR